MDGQDTVVDGALRNVPRIHFGARFGGLDLEGLDLEGLDLEGLDF